MKQGTSPILIVLDNKNISSLLRLWRWTVPGSSTLTRWPKTVWCTSLIESSALWATPSRTIWKAMRISPLLLYVKSHLGEWYQINVMNCWHQYDMFPYDNMLLLKHSVLYFVLRIQRLLLVWWTSWESLVIILCLFQLMKLLINWVKATWRETLKTRLLLQVRKALMRKCLKDLTWLLSLCSCGSKWYIAVRFKKITFTNCLLS